MVRGPQPYAPRPRRNTPAVPDGQAWCPYGLHAVPVESFHKLTSAPTGRQAYCMDCTRDQHLRRTYGISQATYDELLESQSQRCAICRNQPKTQKLAVDHDHKTGEVRGLLCRNCNQKLLGGAFDSAHRLISGALYLMNPPARKVLGDPNERGDVET